MKKIFLGTALSLLGVMTAFQLSAQESDKYTTAAQALADKSFVLQADQIEYSNGKIVTSVVSNENFVLVNGDQGMVQTTSVMGPAGPNNIGGITIAGKVSGIKTKTSKKGNISYRFDIMGNGMTASVQISMAHKTNYASANISATFNGMNITLRGPIVPAVASDLFKANPEIFVPRGMVR